ncbi:MAG TPA: hypothetical protein VHB73_03665 [Alphaproteobacteria bacterium]|nr:hypothetical protein [Alphaproteobacteria bacterium]
MQSEKFARANDRGIAIGPILFIIAILAILATAIAAGSSTFATNSSQETNRTNASAMIQIGQNLKMGVDRLIALGTTPGSVDLNASNTSANNALFSPIGGGLIPPAVSLSSNPASDTWIFTWAAIPNIGTVAAGRIALLKVNQGVCDQINVQAANLSTTPNGVALGNFNNTTNLTTTNWPTGAGGLAGKMVGCFNNTTGNIGYFFYQVLNVQ